MGLCCINNGIIQLSGGNKDENSIQPSGCGIPAGGLHQQQQSPASGENDGGCPAQLRNDSRLSGWQQSALQVRPLKVNPLKVNARQVRALQVRWAFLQTANLPP
jgi:hypothetical protein